jgi:hypothetical protein
LIGVCAEISSKGENRLTAYKIEGDNIRKRYRLGSIQTEESVYQHAFGLSKDFVTIF